MAITYKPPRPWYVKKRHMLWYVPTLLVVAIVVAALATVDDDVAAPADTGDTLDQLAAPDDAAAGDAAPDEGAAGAADSTGLDDPAADGLFTFRVKGFDCGVDRVGDQFLNEEPQGQFCLLDVVVRNTGDEAGQLSSDNQYLLEADGTQHSADPEATLLHDPRGDALWSQINPGNKVRAEIVFDVPKKAELVEAELHDAVLSGGVRVDLTD